MAKRDIEKSIMVQLAIKGADLDHFTDMVKDYMKFWTVKRMLQSDISKRGVVYKDVSSVGVEMMKNNPSVKELVMVNRQMLSILKELGLSTDNGGAGDGDDL